MIKRFARIHSLNKKVTKVIVATQEFIDSLADNEFWVASSVSDTKKLADINDKYDVENNTFTSPKPYESWIFDNTSWEWKPPIEIPDQINEEVYQWNEETQQWDLNE
tara:strand:+ start:726 stop:1046 length:321 start_codon:yes stop_codon:yes gene_type:complete